MFILFLALSLIPPIITQPPPPANILHQFNARTCGMTQLPDDFPTGEQDVESAPIYRGEPADHEDMPWVVYIEGETPDHEQTIKCTGSIIDHWWVVTAAHCLLDERDVNVRLQMEIFAGKRGTQTNVTGRVVGRFVPFPFQPRVAGSSRDATFNPSQYTLGQVADDVGLILLAEPLTFYYDVNSRQFIVNSVCLPTLAPSMNSWYTIAGYGYLDKEDENEAYYLYTYDSTIRDHWNCSVNVHYGMLFDFVRSRTGDERFRMPNDYRQPSHDPSLVCVAAEHRTSTCWGDSGSPLSIRRRNDPDRWELAGVLSGSPTVNNHTFNDIFRAIFHRDNYTFANSLMEQYDEHWQCDHMSYFNVIYQHRAWIRNTLLANRVQGHWWSGPLAVGGYFVGILFTTYVKNKQKPSLVEPMEEGSRESELN